MMVKGWMVTHTLFGGHRRSFVFRFQHIPGTVASTCPLKKMIKKIKWFFFRLVLVLWA